MLKTADIPDEEKGIFLKYTLGGNQKCLFITEDAMYEVLMTSRKPEAKPMRKEIKKYLKMIRATGGVMELGREDDFVENYLGRLSNDIKIAIIKELHDKNEELQKFYDQLINTEGLYHMNTVSKELGIGRNILFSFLRDKNVLFYEDGVNIPYQRFMREGKFAVKETTCNDGKIRPVTYATRKGMEYIRKILTKNGYYDTITE